MMIMTDQRGNGSNACTAQEATRPQTPVESQVSRLGRGLGEINDVVEALYAKLGSVLTPEAPSESKNGCDVAPPASMLVRDLDSLCDRALEILQRLEVLVSRVEL